jgi:hypothetical protein
VPYLYCCYTRLIDLDLVEETSAGSRPAGRQICPARGW